MNPKNVFLALTWLLVTLVVCEGSSWSNFFAPKTAQKPKTPSDGKDGKAGSVAGGASSNTNNKGSNTKIEAAPHMGRLKAPGDPDDKTPKDDTVDVEKMIETANNEPERKSDDLFESAGGFLGFLMKIFTDLFKAITGSSD